eukprot:Awhi_evm1s13615
MDSLKAQTYKKKKSMSSNTPLQERPSATGQFDNSLIVINVNTILNTHFQLSISRNKSIRDIKEIIYQQRNILQHQQQLFLNNTLLIDGLQCKDYNIQSGTTLRLCIKLISGLLSYASYVLPSVSEDINESVSLKSTTPTLPVIETESDTEVGTEKKIETMTETATNKESATAPSKTKAETLITKIATATTKDSETETKTNVKTLVSKAATTTKTTNTTATNCPHPYIYPYPPSQPFSYYYSCSCSPYPSVCARSVCSCASSVDNSSFCNSPCRSLSYNPIPTSSTPVSFSCSPSTNCPSSSLSTSSFEANLTPNRPSENFSPTLSSNFPIYAPYSYDYSKNSSGSPTDIDVTDSPKSTFPSITSSSCSTPSSISSASFSPPTDCNSTSSDAYSTHSSAYFSIPYPASQSASSYPVPPCPNPKLLYSNTPYPPMYPSYCTSSSRVHLSSTHQIFSSSPSSSQPSSHPPITSTSRIPPFLPWYHQEYCFSSNYSDQSAPPCSNSVPTPSSKTPAPIPQSVGTTYLSASSPASLCTDQDPRFFNQVSGESFSSKKPSLSTRNLNDGFVYRKFDTKIPKDAKLLKEIQTCKRSTNSKRKKIAFLKSHQIDRQPPSCNLDFQEKLCKSKANGSAQIGSTEDSVNFDNTKLKTKMEVIKERLKLEKKRKLIRKLIQK